MPPLANGHLDYFQSLAMTNVAMNIHVQVFTPGHTFSFSWVVVKV